MLDQQSCPEPTCPEHSCPPRCPVKIVIGDKQSQEEKVTTTNFMIAHPDGLTYGEVLCTLKDAKKELEAILRLLNVGLADITVERRFHNSFMLSKSQSYEIRKTALASLLLLNDREESTQHRQEICFKTAGKLRFAVRVFKNLISSNQVQATDGITIEKIFEHTRGLKMVFTKK